MNMNNWFPAVIATLLVIGAGIGVGYVLENVGSPQAASGNGIYHLDLVVTTDNYFNASVGQQPAFFVLSGGKLVSSANITLPSDTTIAVTIFNYDNGNGTPSAPQFLNVTGTTGGTEFVMNNTLVNSTYSGNSISVSGGETVSSVNASVLSHTFTILNLYGTGSNLNIPVPESSVVQATFTTGAPGQFIWMCQVPCGSGIDGVSGAMATAGWMTGSITIS
ncbi:MAG: hypothetical protein ACYDAZ_00190 [Thermoplasmataceae archaeon]